MDPSQVDIFTGHSKLTTVARYSPSRLYIASADVSGKVIVWDSENPNHPVRFQYQALAGLINDLNWSPDSLYIVVCGHGKDRNAHVFYVEDGSSFGTVEGHDKLINTCSYRQVRPFSIVTASEDNTVGFHQGIPFHFTALFKFHSHFAQIARFSRNGQTIFSGGADGRLFKYDVKKMENSEVKEFGTPAHKANIYDLCFSPDDKQVFTVSGDKTARLFEVQSGNLVGEFLPGHHRINGRDWQDMQLGCVWQNDYLLTVNACGYLIYHSPDTLKHPIRIVKGHMKPIIALAVTMDGNTIFTTETGHCDEVRGSQQPGNVVDMVIDGDQLVYVCAATQRLHFVPFSTECRSQLVCPDSSSWSYVGELSIDLERQVTLDSTPTAVDAGHGFIVVACVQHIILLEAGEKKSCCAVKYPATCVTIHPGGSTAAAGHTDCGVTIYCLSGGIVHKLRQVMMHAPVSAVAYSPCGAYLAVGAQQRVSALTATDYRELSKREIHRGRVCCVAWSPDSHSFITSATDGKVVLWDDVNDSYKQKPFIIAHAKSYANRVAWLNNTSVVTAGQDSNVKLFTITTSQHSV
ncbi:hypothetical protein ACOMHN_019897 [Nucella lapillus]